MKHLFIIALVSIFVFSCKDSRGQDLTIVDKQIKVNEHPGKKLLETNCYVCHSPTAGHDDRIAPPMVAIKRHYINNETTKKAFTADMKNWIKNPNEKDAKMRGAVRRFGVMPKQAFPEETIEQIADYMFDNQIDEPEWFNKHHKNGKHNDM